MLLRNTGAELSRETSEHSSMHMRLSLRGDLRTETGWCLGEKLVIRSFNSHREAKNRLKTSEVFAELFVCVSHVLKMNDLAKNSH